MAPPKSIPASHPAICVGTTPRRVQPSSIASRDTKSKARRISQLDLSVLPRIDELDEGRIRASAWSEALLYRGEDAVSFPRPRDTSHNDASPEFSDDLQEKEGAEAVESDLFLRVLWPGA